jgi:cytochrome bd-type quinol oxidase subunit 2
MDKKASPTEYMFLPDYVESGFDHGYIEHAGKKEGLVKKKNIIYEAREEDPAKGLPHPLLVFSLLFVIGIFITYRDLRRKSISRWFDIILFVTTGLIGVLLFFLWFFTDHNAAARNLNILWAFPLHLIAGALLLSNAQWIKKYFGFVTIASIILILVWFLLPQKLHYALIPIVALQGIRAYTEFKLRSPKAVSQEVTASKISVD